MDHAKILHIFPAFEIGGSQRRLATYIQSTNTKQEHYVYSMNGCYDAASLAKNIRTLPDTFPAIPKGNMFSAIRAARSALKQFQPDLLVTYNWGAIEWALANSYFSLCPTIHIQDGFGKDEEKVEKPLRRLLRSFAYKRCAKVIVPSQTLYNLAQNSWKTPETRLNFLPNGVDIERFSGDPDNKLMAEHGINSSKKLIGTVAALRPEKNIGRLIEAFSLVEDQYPDTQLVIVGDGVGMSALKMLADRVCNKERVIFTGNISEPERLLPSFDMLALSSDTEQMPLSVIEAMATGLPIVSTDVGDVKFMVSEGNKPFIEGLEADTLSKNICELLATPEHGITIGKQNQNKAQNEYALTQMVTAYDELFTTPNT